MPAPDRFRQIPSVTSLLARDEIRSLLAHHPRAVVLGAIRRLLDGYRSEASGEEGSGRTREEWTSLLIAALPAEVPAGEEIALRRVINATGIVVHTNLGRAPLPEEAIRAISETASGDSNLEFDLAGGTRCARARARTRAPPLAHYERAIGPSPALLLKVHPSNFRITGFTEEATISDLVALGGRLGVPGMEDLGAGARFVFGQAGLTRA